MSNKTTYWTEFFTYYFGGRTVLDSDTGTTLNYILKDYIEAEKENAQLFCDRFSSESVKLSFRLFEKLKKIQYIVIDNSVDGIILSSDKKSLVHKYNNSELHVPSGIV